MNKTRKPAISVNRGAAAEPIVWLSIDNVVVLDSARRPLDLDALSRMAKSIKRDGLNSPIDVVPFPAKGLFRNKYKVIAGAHRRAACAQLGMTKVPVRILTLEQAVGWEQAENLFRHMRVLDESEAMVDYAKKRGLADAPGHRRGGIQPHDRGYKRVADKTGWNRKRVANAYAHTALPENIKKRVRSLKLDNSGKLLTQLSKLTTISAQHDLLQRLHTIQGARSKPKLPKQHALTIAATRERVSALGSVWEVSQVKQAFDREPEEVQRAFLRSLQQ
jgi:hypothetical protein